MDTTTINDHVDSEDAGWPIHVSIIIGLLVAAIGIVNIVGNTCTIIAFGRDTKLRTVANYYIVNLAVTDLVIGISSVPLYGVYLVMEYYWPFGSVYCKIWSVIDFCVCAESSLTIILISYDRFSMVHKGAQYLICESKKKASIRIALTWLAAFLLYSPAIIGYDIWRGYSTVEENDCDVEFSSDLWFTLITSIVEFLIPFVMILILNVLVYTNIRKRTRVHPGERTQEKASDTTKTDEASKKIRQDKKAARSLTMLVVVYFACWLPYVVSTIIIAICDTCVSEDVFEFFNWLLWTNSSLNAFMYAFTNARFRSNYRKLLCYVCDAHGCVPSSNNVTKLANEISITNK